MDSTGTDLDQRVTLFTVGHSNHPFGHFLELLQRHGIAVLADVRSNPYSRYNPQFNKEALAAALKEQGIAYLFAGRELGARSEDPACYERGQVQFGRVAATPLFRSGIEKVIERAAQERLALMCAEKEPLDCHRTLLVAKALVAQGASVQHILADGSLEPHVETMARLLDLVGVPHTDLFKTREQLVEDACAKREGQIAYVADKA